MKKILILGGTQFIGRNLVERLQEMDNLDITLFNRQQTQSHLFPELKKIKGDRESDDIDQISIGHWDYVIDLSCYYPDSLARILNGLKGKVGKYILISTCSVYDNTNKSASLKDEQAKILSCEAGQRTDSSPSSYGSRKAECERILRNSGLDHLILRPSLVYGTYDHTDRFYYWLDQVKHRDTLLLPDKGQRLFSITYVHDLVEVMITALSRPTPSSVYNVTTVLQASIRQVVDHAKFVFNRNVNEVNADAGFLKENNIAQWIDMPLWMDGDYFCYSNERLIQDFEFVPTEFAKSTVNTIQYYNSIGWSNPNYGMSEKTKTELIKKLKY